MPDQSSLPVAIWNAPVWADSSVVVDEAAIEHGLQVGDVGGLDHDDALAVGVVQRDELLLQDDTASVERTVAQVSVAGLRITADQARELASLLIEAAEVIHAEV